MINAHVDISQGLDGESVVLACLDLDESELAASAHAVRAAKERFRDEELSTDDVLELREITVLADELADAALITGLRTIVLRPARLTAYRDSIALFIESRDESEFVREDDREPLARVRALLAPLADLCADALRAALEGPPASHPGRL